MDALAYLATFLSLILGLGVANVLSRLSALVKQGREADWYYLHILWAVYMLFLMACEWWIILQWSKVGQISFWIYVFLLAKPCVLFVASDMLFPDKPAGAKVDLKAHFWTVNRQFLCVLALYPLLDVFDSAFKGIDHLRDLGPTYFFVIVLSIAAVSLGIWTRDERVHLGIVLLMYASVALSMVNALSAV